MKFPLDTAPPSSPLSAYIHTRMYLLEGLPLKSQLDNHFKVYCYNIFLNAMLSAATFASETHAP